MKNKISSLCFALFMSISFAFAQAPTPADLAAEYDVINNVVFCIQFIEDAEVCNDIYFVGSSNNWGKGNGDTEAWINCEKFLPFPGFEGWYVAEIPYGYDFQGKPLQAPTDGIFTWDYQCGDKDAWVHVDGLELDITDGYADECNIAAYAAGPYIYQLKYWKRHKTPCVAVIKHQYSISLYIPDACPDMKPGIAGDDMGWSANAMTEDVDEDFNTIYKYEFDGFEGHGFKFLDAELGWDNELMYLDNTDSWRYFSNIELGADSVLVFDYSDNEHYRFALCGLDTATYQVVVYLAAPAGAPSAGVEIIGSFDGWIGTTMTLRDDGVYETIITAKAYDQFKFREAGTWDNMIEIYNDESGEWESIQDGQFIFGQLWEDDTWKGNPCKRIELDWSDATKYRWSAEPESIPTIVPSAPTRAEADIMALFSSSYQSNNLNFAPTNWGSKWINYIYPTGEQIWHTDAMMWDCFTSWDATSYNLTAYDMMHVDIYVTVDSKLKFTFEALGTGDGGSGWKNGLVVEGLQANQWNSVDIDLLNAPFDSYDFTDLRYLILEGFTKADGGSAEGTPLSIANVYFWNSMGSPYKTLSVTYNPLYGGVTGGGQYIAGSNVSIIATANEGYRFVQWSDGNTENPRTIQLTQDTTFTAIFAEDVIILPEAQVWPIVMDDITFDSYQENIVGDFRNNNIDNHLYIWGESATYSAQYPIGLNYYQNEGGYMSLRVLAPQGWSGGGYYVSNLRSLRMMQILKDSIVAHPNDYYLHIAMKSSDQSSHQFCMFENNQISFTIGTTPIEQGVVIGDFPRDGEWHSIYVPLASYASTIAEMILSETGVNVFYFLSGSAVGAELNLDAVYFCNTAFKDLVCTPYTHDISVNDVNGGRVSSSFISCPQNELYINAVPNYGYHFVQWSDGVTENPRTVVITQDTTIVAEFAVNTDGQCGDSLMWSLENDTLNIIGTGDMWDGRPWIISCESIRYINLPQELTGIGQFAFAYCSKVTSLSIPASVTRVGYDAFYGCNNLVFFEGPVIAFEQVNRSNLQSVIINGGMLSNSAYINMLNANVLTNLDMREVNCTTLSRRVLLDFYNLQELYLPNNLENIEYMAAAGCKNLRSMVIPATVVEIGSSAFEDCRSLSAIQFAEGSQLQKIGSWGFYNCHALQNLTIPEGVTEIGAGAFYGCVYLQNISIPASVVSIGDNTFALCSKVARMDVDAVLPPEVESKTFYEVSTTAPVYVPDESVSTYKAHPVWGQLNIVAKSDAQAIDNIFDSSDNVRKIYRDGQILILRGEKMYTLQGQEVK